jgi:acetoin utilization protein AcuB
MEAKDLISDIVPVLHTSDTGAKALNWMEIFRISHLPIVNNEDFLGLISDTDIYDYNMADEPVGTHSLSLIRPYVLYNQHIYEVVEIVSRLKLSVVPVLDENMKYLGIISSHDLVQQFANLAAVQHPGGILILELNINDYSLSQISQIIESNDAKILSLYVGSHPDSTKMDLTIKINSTNITSIIQTLQRYNYNIKASFLEDDKLKVLYEDRYQALMTYLSV